MQNDTPTDFSKRWKELSGDKHWDHLLKPFDNDMKLYLTHYGDLVEATYTSFVTQTVSRFAGGANVPKGKLFSAAGIMGRSSPFSKYKVTKYMYATSHIQLPQSFMVKSLATNPWTKDSNWIGYVAVVTDEGVKEMGRRDIVIAWRGTILASEWAKDFDFKMVSGAKLLNSKKNPLLHEGFLAVYTSSNPKTKFNKTSARDQAITELKRLLEVHKNEEVSITVVGHSLGAAIATLNAADIVANDIAGGKKIPVTAFPYASPRVGNVGFKEVVDELGAATNSNSNLGSDEPKDTGVLRILRIVNKADVVPTVPPAIGFNYVHVGQKFLVNSSLSPFLKNPYEIGIAHDMEVYIHCINASKGTLMDFSASHIQRDISLINKFTDGLKPQYNVEKKWWCSENTGMKLQDDGNYRMTAGDWVLKDHSDSEEEEVGN